MANTRTRKKKRRSPLPVIIMVAFVLLIGAGAILIYNRYSETSEEMDKLVYYDIQESDQAPLVVDDHLLETYGVVRNQTIYIDYQTVLHYLNSGFYWEPETQEMLLTLPEGTLVWTPEDGSGAILREGETIYISADIIREQSDIDMTILQNPDRVVARTRWTNLAAETVLSDTVVRYRGGPKSPILTKLSKGDLVVLTSNADDWCEVSTADGFIGYVKKKEVQAAEDGAISHTSDPRFAFPKLSVDGKINMAWQYCDAEDGSAELTTLTNGAVGLNTISPTWFSYENAAGDLRSVASAEYVNLAHEMGLKVWGALQDVYGGAVSSPSVLRNRAVRAHIIDQLMTICTETQMDGINVDIETITEESVPQYLQFLRELSVAAHQQNVIVSVDNYVPLYTAYLDRAAQAKVVDYLVIMGYDEHTAGSAEAGSVASLPFVEQGIKDTLAEVPASQVINAIPFYSRGWMQTIGEDLPSSEALGMDAAVQWAQKYGVETAWDSSVGQETGTIKVEDTTYSIWLENERSIEEKMKLIQKYNLAGVAAWRLGFERMDVWEIIRVYLN